MFLIIKSNLASRLRISRSSPTLSLLSTRLYILKSDGSATALLKLAKPWQSTRYKTCDGCRGKRAEQRRAEKPAGGAVTGEPPLLDFGIPFADFVLYYVDADSSLINEEDRTRREMVEAEEVATHGGKKTFARRVLLEGPLRMIELSPDTPDLIPSCLEEEFPRYAAATEKFTHIQSCDGVFKGPGRISSSTPRGCQRCCWKIS